MLLSTIAKHIQAQLDGPDHNVTRVRPVESAGPGDITYLVEDRSVAPGLHASAVIVDPGAARNGFLPDTSLLRMTPPYLGFAKVMMLFHPPRPPSFRGISPLASLDPSVTVGSQVHIAPGVVIGPDSRLGDRVVLHAGVTIGENVEVGDDVVLYPRVVIYDHSMLGHRVVIHAGSVIGSDGFGYAPGPGGAVKIIHAGRVLVEADVEIGANTTVDRGVLDDTVIGVGTKIDNLVQVGHNCVIGPHCIIAGQAGLAGSCTLGAGVKLGGQSGLGGHLKVGAGAQIAGKSGVHKDVPEGASYLGYPATDLRTARRAMAILYRLPELRQHVDSLSRRLEALLESEN